MWDIFIDAAGYLAIALAALYFGTFLFWPRNTRRQRLPTAHLRIAPNDTNDGVEYQVLCHTGNCDFAAIYDTADQAREAISQHFEYHENHQP